MESQENYHIVINTAITNPCRHLGMAHLCQGGRHGGFPAHAVADEDALLDVQLAEEVFQISSHRLVGQLGGVGAVTMVTGIYS